MTTIDISAELAARGHGAKSGPRFGIDRSYVSEAEGFRAWCAEPAHDAALSWVGDSTLYSTRIVWQLAQLLAARLPQIKVIYRIGDWANGNPVWADFGTANDGTVSRVFNAPTWAAAGPGVDDTNWWLPGTAGYYVVLPASRRYTPWGPGLTKGFVGVDLAPGTWRPAANMSMIQQSGTAKGTIFRLGTDGRITIITSPDGTATASGVSSTAVPYTTDGERKQIGVAFDLDTGTGGAERSYRFLYRTDPTAAWQALGTTVTGAGASSWGGGPAEVWTIGQGAILTGRVYGMFGRLVDEHGPDLIPRSPQLWQAMTAFMRGYLQGGRVLTIWNSAWPQHGLDDVARRTDIGLPSVPTPVFNRPWQRATATSANSYSYLQQALPLVPYLLTVLTHGHNDIQTAEQDIFMRAVEMIRARTFPSQLMVGMQNPELRSDGPTPVGSPLTDPRSISRNVDMNRAAHQAWARGMGLQTIDVHSGMADYARAGGAMGDLLQTTGQRLHPNTVGGQIQAEDFANKILGTDFVPGVLT